MNATIKKCIENTISRVENSKNRMNAFSYINYFCKRNNLTIEDNFYIREEVSKYIDENSNRLFQTEFTINGLAY